MVRVHAYSSATHPSRPSDIDLLSLVVEEMAEGPTNIQPTFTQLNICDSRDSKLDSMQQSLAQVSFSSVNHHYGTLIKHCFVYRRAIKTLKQSAGLSGKDSMSSLFSFVNLREYCRVKVLGVQ